MVFSGNFVYLFFVLSGFVLAESASRRREPFVLRAARRYLRLALPVTVSVAYAWFLIYLFPRASHDLIRVLPQEWMRHSLAGDIPSFWHVFPEGFYWTFRHGYSLYNNVLWTMHTELYGSLFIFLIYLVRDSKKRLLAIVMSGIMTIFILHALVSFVFGALLREAWVRGRVRTSRAGILLIVIALILISYHPELGRRPDRFIYPAGGALAILAVLMCAPLARFFSSRILQFLGRISFSLYLTHVPLLMTVLASAYLAWLPINGWKLAALFLCFLTTSITIAYTMTVILDEPLTRGLKRLRARTRRLVSGLDPLIPVSQPIPEHE